MSAHRLVPPPARLTTGDRVQLLLALCCALTLTPFGAAMAAVVLAVLLARRGARRMLERSVAVGGGILAPAQGPGLLHAAGHRREAVARP